MGIREFRESIVLIINISKNIISCEMGMKKKSGNKSLKIVIRILILFSLITIINIINSYADVGDFETYDESSSWYDGLSSSSSSTTTFEDSSFSNGGTEEVVGGGLAYLLFLLVKVFTLGTDPNANPTPIVIFIICVFSGLFILRVIRNRPEKSKPYTEKESKALKVDEFKIENKIKQIDPDFNRVEMLTWAADLYEKLQEAWTKRDFTSIRFYESNELYSQHSMQLKQYIEKKQINKIENVEINYIKLYDFSQRGNKDVLTIILNSTKIDYIIDENTEEVLQGDIFTKRKNTYKLTFIRNTGTKTKIGNTKVNITNCPNCNAPVKLGESGECPYCKTIITTGEFNWVLLNLEPFNE